MPPAKPRTFKGTRRVAPTTKRYVKRAIASNIENKYHIADRTNANIAYDVPLIDDITDVPGGSTAITRNGLVIKPQSIQIKGIINALTATDQPVVVRIFVFQYFQDTAPTLPLFIRTPANVAYEIIDPLLDYKNYKMLSDTRYVLGTDSDGGHSTEPFKLISISIPMKKLQRKLIYFETGATTGKNHIWVIVASNIAIAQANPQMAFQARLKYKDI